MWASECLTQVQFSWTRLQKAKSCLPGYLLENNSASPPLGASVLGAKIQIRGQKSLEFLLWGPGSLHQDTRCVLGGMGRLVAFSHVPVWWWEPSLQGPGSLLKGTPDLPCDQKIQPKARGLEALFLNNVFDLEIFPWVWNILCCLEKNYHLCLEMVGTVSESLWEFLFFFSLTSKPLESFKALKLKLALLSCISKLWIRSLSFRPHSPCCSVMLQVWEHLWPRVVITDKAKSWSNTTSNVRK